MTAQDVADDPTRPGCTRALVACGLTAVTIAAAAIGGAGSAVAILILLAWFAVMGAGLVHAWRSGEIFEDEFAGIEEREQVDRVLREHRR
jgi:hypothetical protein